MKTSSYIRRARFAGFLKTTCLGLVAAIVLAISGAQLQAQQIGASEVAKPPAFVADGPSVLNALRDVRDALRSRADRLEQVESAIADAASVYREDRSSLNFARVQRELADFLRIDLQTRHEVAHVADESSRALERFVTDLDRIETDQRRRGEFLRESRASLLSDERDAVQALRASGITREMLLQPEQLPLEAQERVLSTLQRLEIIADTRTQIDDLESNRQGLGEEFATYRDAVRHDAMHLRLMAERARGGIEGIRLVAESVNDALDLVAVREIISAIDQNRVAWQMVTFKPMTGPDLGPRPLPVPVARPRSAIDPSSAALQRLAELLAEGTTAQVGER